MTGQLEAPRGALVSPAPEWGLQPSPQSAGGGTGVAQGVGSVPFRA